ncbi:MULTISPECIES: RsmB/NOP family class I SAM-dependent RNA methyltransferase [Methylobacterium]|jgi:16S rRNA (cytosine967-C5)-methyltransferase|uniref:RsmB/NOP family class I SAM-dependent RNA methyltransferase n=1 Tax=Methylobacterium TaxID=407 RepID=UPI0008F150A4|nr:MULTISPECIES: RsmB/NOP family class I SAM-dependent RNA methyltransferase [Methylobacterium]MBK3399426.1 RsmB/NOP family class I SAM-dependent RNA methyltransferase [Methylobacterium ajmalii]MBK3406969.1 RsmB/NOP family class I SAM-dependent RNA methyltransferase [Methylobacterium ajmalii]MBZ6411347.1 RsmB/NOP family class I SAM-dependent RNA methyltransferase [Methylobacterium sp.]SFE54636.1 16S rRNA (cytosine967-C5)-methyltransferase [Methylobacterium sp. yr596]
MTPGARLSAAIEVLADIAERRRPVADALKDWGLAHRFAGSGDRATIATLVYDALRRRASAAWIMGEDSSRAVLIGSLRLQRGLAAQTIAELFTGERFAPAPLTEAERTRLETGTLADAPVHVAGDVPEWIVPSLASAFGDDLLPELRSLARRAPLDIRVNTLKASRDATREALAHLNPEPTPLAPDGLRVPLGEDGRGPALHVEPEFLDGWFEIQDEGSQLAARLSGAKPGMTVVDLCAGGGGKTLALAALMGNEGRLVATDGDPRRLAPIHERLRRAGARAEVRTPRGGPGRRDAGRPDVMADLDGSADLVLVDAPCTGAGTWRRNPDAKWRLRPGSLATRVAEQEAVLDRAARLTRPGGRIVYVTCSLLPQENDAAVAGLAARRDDLALRPLDLPASVAERVRRTAHGIQMSPERTGTDGFYVALIERGPDRS